MFGVIKLHGGGLSGYGIPMPSDDIRGFRFGIAARRLLPSLTHATLPPLHWEKYDHWHRILQPCPNPVGKMLKRLRDAGLIWIVQRYAQGSDTQWEHCVALTDLGQKVVDVFGDDMQRGQRVRWDKWSEASVAGSLERWDTLRKQWVGDGLLECFPNDKQLTDIQKEINCPSYRKPLQYGNSNEYILRRISRFDDLWGDVLMFPGLYTSGSAPQVG